MAEFCENPGCLEKFRSLERDVNELKHALRGEGGIFDTLKRLEIQFVTFTTTVTSSVRTTVALGSAAGGLLGALGALVAIAAFLRAVGK